MGNIATHALEALVAADSWVAAHAPAIKQWLDAPDDRTEPWFELIRDRRLASRARVDAGLTDWGRWSSKILALREDLIGHPKLQSIVDHVVATDLDRERFLDHVDLAGAQIPGDLILDGAIAHRDIWLSGATVRGRIFARRLRVDGSLIIESGTFASPFDLSSGVVCKSLQARNVSFVGAAIFNSAVFNGDAWCSGSAFNDRADFSDAAFSGEAGFGSISFESDAGFQRTRFRGNAGFESAQFRHAARFDDATFEQKVWFTGAHFEETPSFQGTKSNSMLDLSRASVPVSSPARRQIDELKRRIGIAGD